MKINRRTKKYIKKLMKPELGNKVRLVNKRPDPDCKDYWLYDVILKDQVIGDAVFNHNGVYETGHWKNI